MTGCDDDAEQILWMVVKPGCHRLKTVVKDLMKRVSTIQVGAGFRNNPHYDDGRDDDQNQFNDYSEI